MKINYYTHYTLYVKQDYFNLMCHTKDEKCIIQRKKTNYYLIVFKHVHESSTMTGKWD